MLSRVADAVYWMNRYIERAENYARFLDVNFNLSLDLLPHVEEQWKPLVLASGDWDLYKSLYGKVSKNSVIYFLAFDPLNPNSIYNSLILSRKNARAIRPELTKEVWEQINHLYYFVKHGYENKVWQKKDLRTFFLNVRKGCQLLYGIFDSTISRNDVYHFGKIGQMLERADKTSRVLDVKYHILLPKIEEVGSPIDLIQWAALLKSVSAFDMYRKKYGKLSPKNISEFLVLDKLFPRSILHCINNAEKSLQFVNGGNKQLSNNAEEQIAILLNHVDNSKIETILNNGLHEYLDNLQGNLNVVSTSMIKTFFSVENFQQ